MVSSWLRHLPVAQCIDLRKTFGTRYRYEWDPAYQTETPDGRKRERAWLTRIPCKYGYIAPHSDRHLAAHSDAGPIKRRQLESLDCVDIHQGGGSCPEVIVTFDVADIAAVAEVLQARKPRVYSPEERARLRDRLARVRPSPERSVSPAREGHLGGQERRTGGERT